MVRSLVMLLLVGMAPFARARNVDLSTVPGRDSVQLTIYNSEDITLVRETRLVTFKKGLNPLQFSWANTLIDSTSVELKFLTKPDQLEVLDTTFPHDKPQMLYWNVQSEMDGEAKIEISYFTSGITWSADYQVIANPAETALKLEGFVRVFNRSGEEYENAQVRLVVGTINLVEKIAALASIAQVVPAAATPMPLVTNGAIDVNGLMRGDLGRFGGGAGQGNRAPEEKVIVKEGLSEYFIYTIEGTETIKNGWSKRMRSIAAEGVEFKIQYRYRPVEYGEQLVRMYLLTNDVKSKLGTTPLPDGMVRLFRENGRDGLSYLTQQAVKYIPIGDKIELNLGPDPEVIFEWIKLKSTRENLWLQQHGTNTYKKFGEKVIVKEPNFSVAGWENHSLFTQRIRNYSPKPIEVEVRRQIDGDATFRSGLMATNHDYRTVQYTTTVPAGKKVNLLQEVVVREGYLKKQDRVLVEAAELTP